MDYLKFNCHNLAEQNVELSGLHRKMQSLQDELSSVLNALDPQITSYEDIRKRLTATHADVAGVSLQISTLHNLLDQIVDLYYAAENNALQAAENLPVSVNQAHVNTQMRNISAISTSSINSGDLVLEDWLTEFLYRNTND